MAESRVESVPVSGGAFDLTVWLPRSGSGPGLLLIQEIYGVSDYIRAVAEDLAELGYVVGAPDLFWRLTPGYQAAHDDAGLATSLEMGARFDFEQGVTDAGAALDHLAALPEVRGGTGDSGDSGVIGFCLGGSIAYFLAARSAAPTAAVAFYGSAVPDSLAVLEQISVPLQFHFGGSDPYITRDQVAQVEQAVAGRANVELHVEETAGHAFHNRKAPMFHNPEPAARAWRRTEEFLRRHLPAGPQAAS
jgi:carboxymethylenebutenolidase